MAAARHGNTSPLPKMLVLSKLAEGQAAARHIGVQSIMSATIIAAETQRVSMRPSGMNVRSVSLLLVVVLW